MPKILKASFPEKCNGCELCVIEMQKQVNKIGLDGALIRIKRIEALYEGIEYVIEVDPHINALDIKKIAEICPKAVFTLEERLSEDELVH